MFRLLVRGGVVFAFLAMGPIAVSGIGTWLHFADLAAGPIIHARVTRVVDGDTVILAGMGPARLIGVDTPEKGEPWHRYATEFTAAMVDGKNVQVRFDERRHDRYGRVLVYLYSPDGRLVNVELLRAGYAEVFRAAPFRYQEAFAAAQREARDYRRGMWKQ